MHDSVCVQNSDGNGELAESFPDVVDVHRTDDALLPSQLYRLVKIEARQCGASQLDERMLQLGRRQMLEELGSANQLHRENPVIADDEQLIQARQVRMPHLGQSAEFAFEARYTIGGGALEHF